MFIYSNLVCLICIFTLFNSIIAEPAVKKCEVCQKVINKVLDTLKDENKESNPDNIENYFISYCKNTQIDVEKRFVSYHLVLI